jgi:hypothetical protein
MFQAAANHGIEAKVIGYVTEEPGIRILNRGTVQNRQQLVFSPND